jgi:hypothetical protein
MGFFKRLAGFFSSPGGDYDPAYWLTVRCKRCGEIIRTRIDLRNDLSLDYGEGDAPGTTYFTRKVLMGENRCFQQIEIELRFDAAHKLIERTIHGGDFVDEASSKK